MNDEQHVALLRALGILDQEPEDEGPSDFDGGVREPAPAPADPLREHDQTLLEAIALAPGGQGGGEEW